MFRPRAGEGGSAEGPHFLRLRCISDNGQKALLPFHLWERWDEGVYAHGWSVHSLLPLIPSCKGLGDIVPVQDETESLLLHPLFLA